MFNLPVSPTLELEVLRRRYIIARWVFFGSFIAMLLLFAVFFSSPA